MILTKKNMTQRKTYPSATLSTTKFLWTVLVKNQGHRSENLAIDYQNLSTDMQINWSQ
jgi:hypothetical protein